MTPTITRIWPAPAPDDAVVGRGYPDVPPSNVHYGNIHAGNWHTMVFAFGTAPTASRRC